MLKTLFVMWYSLVLMEAEQQPIRLGFLEREIVHCNYASINVKNLVNFYIRSQCASLLALTMLGVCWIMLCFSPISLPYGEREGQKFWMPFGQVISNYHRSISDIIIQPIVSSGFKTGNFFLAIANSLRIFTCLTAVFLTHHEMAPFCLSGLEKCLQRPPIRLLFNSQKISPLND